MRDTFTRILKEDIWILNSKKQQAQSQCKDILMAFFYEVSAYVEDEEAISGGDTLTNEEQDMQEE